MPTSEPEDQPEADSVELEAARAVSEFLEARNANPQVSPDEFAPGEPEAARAFWKAVEGAGALVGDLGAKNGHETDTVKKTGTGSTRTIGGHRILRVLGEGGMGIVYEAEQQHPRRPIALKVIRGGRYIDQHHLRLFQREAQTLARLKHPYIAGIYEAGRTDDGQHFFAMELVRGEPLKEYVQRKKLTMQERLELFRRICEGINYAHQRGVIHRDLKPSNVFIDAEGNPKILDFGLAKITDVDISVTTVVTEIGKIQGTLPYMSPEQARGNPDEIDLRSDVYSLGVILYELLTDQLPYNVSKAMLHEAVRVICEEEPRRPSTISKTLRGDVETIALKALEKEPSRRYPSVSALAEDIERYLTDQPILARPPSAMYQFKKLVARHKAPFAFVAALFVLITAFGLWMSVMYARAEELRQDAVQTRDNLETVVDFQQSMLSDIDAEQMGRGIFADLRDEIREALETRNASPEDIDKAVASFGASLTGVNATNLALKVVHEHVLSRAVETIHKQFADQPLVEAALRQTVGDTYGELGLYPQAAAQMERALALRRRELGNEHVDTLPSMTNLGLVYDRQGRHDEAETLHMQAREISRRVRGEEHPFTLTFTNNLALVYEGQGRYDEAEELFVKTLEIRRRVLGEEHPDTLTSINNLGLLYLDQARYGEAEPLYTRAVELRRRLLGESDPKTLISMNSLGLLYQTVHRYDEAKPLLERTLELRREVLGEEHSQTLTSMNNLALLYSKQDRYDEAQVLYVQALELHRRVVGEYHPNTLNTMNNLGMVYLYQERYDEAKSMFEHTLDGRRRVLPEAHPQTLMSMSSLAQVYGKQERYDEAEPLYAEAVRGARASLRIGHPHLGFYLLQQGRALTKLGRYAGAETALRESHEIVETAFGAEDERTIKVIQSLADLYDAWHEAEPGQGYDAEGAEWRTKLPAAERAGSLIKLGKRLLEAARHAEAEAALGECLEIRQEALPEGHWLIFNTMSVLGASLAGQGADPSLALGARIEKLREAEPLLLEGYEGLEDHPEAPDERKHEALERIVKLYEAWHAAEPGKRYDAEGAEWRAKLLITQPVPADEQGTSSNGE